MSFRLESFHGGQGKTCMLMHSQGGEIRWQDKGKDILPLLKFKNTFTGKLQQMGGQGTITKVLMGIKSPNSETRGVSLFPAQLQKGNRSIVLFRQDEKEALCRWMVQ